jgi:hypothetical protein
MNHGARGVPGARGDAVGGLAAAVSSTPLLRELREHRALRDSCRAPAGKDRPNVTGCHEPPGRRREETAASTPLMTTRHVKM